jgi:DNA-binding LacI/PurR family transcriptional regulator
MKPHKNITIYYIARKLELSSATVSLGLNNNPPVKKNTYKKIVLVPANLNRNVYARRHTGYTDALFDNNLPYDKERLLIKDLNYQKLVIKKN